MRCEKTNQSARGMRESRCARMALALLLTVSLLAGLAGCSEPASRESKAADRTFVDSAGRSVELPSAIDAVAPSGTYAQMFLITLCPEKLTGLSTALTRRQKEFLPEYLQDLPTLGQFYGGSGTVNYEAIIAAKPDVIVDIGERKDSIVEDMDYLQKKTGVPVVFLESSLASIPETYTALGELTGAQDRADELSGYCQLVLDNAALQAKKVESDPKRRVRVYSGDGEFGTEASPAGSLHSEIFDMLGAENVAQLEEASDTGKKEVPLEQILIWDPEVIFLTTDANYDEIYEDEKWASVQAVQNHRVYEVPSAPYNWIDRPPSVQRILGIQWVGYLLYPDLFDIDIRQVTKEYYQLFYQYELTNEETNGLLGDSLRVEDSE